MLRKQRIKRKVKRLANHRARRILQIHKLKRNIAARHRIGFVMLGQQS